MHDTSYSSNRIVSGRRELKRAEQTQPIKENPHCDKSHRACKLRDAVRSHTVSPPADTTHRVCTKVSPTENQNELLCSASGPIQTHFVFSKVPSEEAVLDLYIREQNALNNDWTEAL